MRDISQGMLDAITSAQIHAFLLLEIDCPAGALRLWTGLGDLPWDGMIFKGTGGLGKISKVIDTTANRKTSLSFSMNMLDPDVLPKVRDEVIDDAPVNLWFGVFAPDGTIVPDPVPLARRRANPIKAKFSGETITLTQTTYGRYDHLNRRLAPVWDNATHQVDHPDDQFFAQHLELLDLPLEIKKRD